MQNTFFKFLAELATRLFSKNPKFFDVVQMVALVVGGLSGLVQYLQSTGVELPAFASVVGNINVVVSSVVALILAQLPNDTSSTDAK